MGGAIIASACRLGLELYAYDHVKEKIDSLAGYNVKPAGSVKELSEICDVIFLAVKPQGFEEMLAELKGNISQEHLFVSIAAGITAEYIQSALGIKAKIILAMPNTPLLLGYGATALSRIENVNDDEFEIVKSIFEGSGIVEIISPSQMLDVIPIHGSSPAFIYRFAKNFLEYGKEKGFDEEVSLRLFAQSLIGSAKMLTESGYDIDKLIEMVSSKGGTTIAGLDGLTEKGFDEDVRFCCDKCVKRAYELKK